MIRQTPHPELPVAHMWLYIAFPEFSQHSQQWSAEADRAFCQLKALFTSAPMLAHPDPSLAFIVEVDASESGIGAVLSQCSGMPLTMCSGMRNYDVGDRELLAVVRALKAWRHWLEGAKHLFLIWTDHRNLEYIRAAWRLNTRQARWAMFFTRFVFTLSYRPGSQNVKADALSRMYDTEERSADPTPIIPASCLVAPVVWEVDADIERASRAEPTPPQCPVGHLYVPFDVRDCLICWAHTSPSSGHPGIGRTVRCLAGKYWWPTLAKDVRVCAQCKAPRHLPRGKLQPLPVPQRPWPHLSVDFVTDLPPSRGNTTILVVVDQFSKSCHLFPLPGLPTALQTAEALFTHVFRHYGMPEDIVSDRGPQFTSKVWRALMEPLGVSVSLTSGFHPESNGQVERVNQDVGRFLRSYCQDRPGEWFVFIPWVEMAQNSLCHSSTNLSPFQCVLGYQPVLAPWHQSQIEAPAVDEWFRHSEVTWDAAHVRLQLAIRRQKASATAVRRVWLSTRNLPFHLPYWKLGPRFVGPFKVLRRLNDVCYRLQLPPDYSINPSFHVSLLGRWWLVRSSSLRCPLWTLRGHRHIMCEPSWTQDVGREAFSTPWSGRGTVRRRDAGCRWRTSWIHHYCRNFTASIRIALRLVLRVVPEADEIPAGGTVTTSAEVGPSPSSGCVRHHRLSRHHRSMFHFCFVLFCLDHTHLVSIPFHLLIFE
uniref:Gypsy retrotransposon integrase-like protein 1 n=1 Tax=Oncorhynchus mykiss TaxID=8022 RepID=A0A8C7RX13_ONCMY